MAVIPDLITNAAVHMKGTGALDPNWPFNNFWLHWLVFTVIAIAVTLTVVMGFIYMERRLLGRLQARLGPNRTGPQGILQPVADAIKVLLKEDILPDAADKVVYFLAPVVSFFPVLMIFAVIPWQNGAALTNLNIGLLYVLAISSISSVGVFMAGWSSSNKYSLLGAMRDIASLVSYEIPLMLSVVGLIAISGSMSLNDIVAAQNLPFILLQPLGFLVFFIAGCAEINRSPFDLLEADSELVAGHHTEYSGMKFAMFYLVEYAEALAFSAIIATIFLSGWKGPGLPGWLWLFIKIFAVFGLMIWTRSTFPRVRIDQLMALAWKFLFPLSLLNLLITGLEILISPGPLGWIYVVVNFAVMGLLVLLWSKLFSLGWGKVEV